jgi:hypothetical protein
MMEFDGKSNSSTGRSLHPSVTDSALQHVDRLERARGLD